MGIKNLTALIRDKSPESIESVSLYTFQGKTVAIDTSIFLYRALTNVRSNGDYLRNHEGKIVSHIVGLFHNTIQYLSLGITPIYIFDGKPPKEKYECIQERKAKARECQKQMDQEQDPAAKKHLEKGTIRINKGHIDDLKVLFDHMGVQYLQSDSEAESYAGELCRIGYVDAVVSEDMDTMVYGTPLLLRKCVDRSIKRKDVVSVFNLKRLLADLEMDLAQFTDLCILCGCDYCGTLPKIGPVRAYQHMKTYGSIEKLIESGIVDVPEFFSARYQRSRELFQIFTDKIDIAGLPSASERPKIDFDKLETYMIEGCSMDQKRVKTALNKVKRAQMTMLE
jgi:flap endonuclease-1